MTGPHLIESPPRGRTATGKSFTTTLNDKPGSPSSTRAHSTPPPSAWARGSSSTDGGDSARIRDETT